MQEQLQADFNVYDPTKHDPERTVFKLLDNKITFTKYHKIEKTFAYFDEYNKIDLKMGSLHPWTYLDYLKRRNSYRISLNRTKRTINKLSELNPFSHFLTMTFNENYVDRKNAIAVHNKYRAIMKRLKHKFGKLEFLSVGEFHEDKAIHYHIMINFERKPRLRFKGYSKKGHAIYHMREIENFFNEDCFLVFEKLQANCTHYLTKYITKDNEQPYTRRFGCSKGLKRPKILDCIVDIPWHELKQVALDHGFSYVFENKRNGTIEYNSGTGETDTASAERGGIDSLYIDIKGGNQIEHLSKIYYDIVNKVMNSRTMTKKAYEMCRPPQIAENLQVIEKREFQQLNFIMDKNNQPICEDIF